MAAAVSSKPKAGKPVTTRHLAAALAEQHQLTKKQGLQMLEDLIGMITKHLKKGERVKIAGLGILLVRKRAARMPQPDDRRSDQDQGKQKGRLPRCQGFENGDLIVEIFLAKPRRSPAGFCFCTVIQFQDRSCGAPLPT